jgi:CDP-glucose 4,6-dehydratase
MRFVIRSNWKIFGRMETHPGKFGNMGYKEIFTRAYSGKKVLLTGHTGFKGSWLLTWLHQLGADIKGYALKPETDKDLYHLISGDELCDSVIADIRDKEMLSKVVTEFQPDFIFHLAAQPIVRRSYQLPLYTFEVNANGTAHLLEAVRVLQKPCNVVIITTDKVYENREIDYAYNENDKLGGYDPYSASKALAEIIVSSYRDSFFNIADFAKHGKVIATARAGNVIGAGDRASDRIVPDIVRALEANQPVKIRNPHAIRPWQHVLEPLSGYLLLGAQLSLEPSRYTGSWNLGPVPDDVLTVEQLVQHAIQCFGQGSYEIPENTPQPHEAGILKLDISKADSILGWQPRLTAVQSVEETMTGYKELFRLNHQIIKEQIEKYLGLC